MSYAPEIAVRLSSLVKTKNEQRAEIYASFKRLEHELDEATNLLQRALDEMKELRESAVLWETRYNEQTELAANVLRERDEATACCTPSQR